MSAKLSAVGPKAVSPGSVSHWKRVGHVPAKRQQQVLTAAQHYGLDLTPDDFFERGSA